MSVLRDELAGQTAEIQRAIFAALNSGVIQSGLGSAEFAAALDLADIGDLTGSVDPAPLVSAYIRSVAAGAYTLSANRITESAAASLVKLAMRNLDDQRQKFFAPVDVRARIAAAAEPSVNPLSIEDETARAMRAHIRVLCRAVVGFQDSTPNELPSALIEAVRLGAVKHDEKGRIGAFAARFETDPYRGARDRPISSDLAAALAALVDGERQRLLSAILDIDEPIVLAQLLGLAPQETRGRIEAKLDELTPQNVATIRSLPEATARIDALLRAGRADAATRFIASERELKTWGPVAGREVTQLRDDLYLKWLRKDWDGIFAAVPPQQFSGQILDSAHDVISFFKGLAVLGDPSRGPEGAVNFFGELHRRHPYTATYAVNFFAAEISKLLGTDGFVELQGAALSEGRQIVAALEQAVLSLRDATAADLETLNSNKALLLLALGEPHRALSVLEAIVPGRLRDSVAAYSAVALNRMDRTREALAVLDQGVRAVGETRLLLDVREYIRSGKQFMAAVSVASNDSRVPSVKMALFNLYQMNPEEQTAALLDVSEPLLDFTVRQVRMAGDSVISTLAAMKAEKPNFHEDDITGFLRMPLAAGVPFLGWTIPDQSPGGYSPAGNPGKRDLIIQCHGWTLAVIEAVICRDPIDYQSVKNDLTSHFQRLLGYFPGSLFFHLTYSYVDDPASVLGQLKQIAETAAPPPFTYKGIIKDLEPSGSLPRGVARLVGIEGGVVSGVINLESSGVEAPDWRPRHDEYYHEA